MSLDRKCYRHSLTFSAQPAVNDKNPSRSKKKRNYGFATFKKKLIGKRRHGKGSDHGRCFREHFLDCSSPVLKSLLSQYESLTLLKDLSVQANLARPPAPTLGQSLADILSSGACSDLTLLYCGHRFPVHKHVLMARCPYFGRHLTPDQTEFQLRLRNCAVSPGTLGVILGYLYTGNPDLLRQVSETESLAPLEEEFGIPNSLESDVSFLGESGTWADCKLVFAPSSLELSCHKAVLAARSGFFQRLLEKSDREEICLDNDVIPAKYGPALVHAMYMDALDTRLIRDEGFYGDEEPSEATYSPRSSEEEVMRDVMNLYEIGKFLEFSFLSQCCEDALMQMMTIHNVVEILNWSLEPQGSGWIARQAYQYLEEEFYTFSSNVDLLGKLDQDTLIHILQSDFTQVGIFLLTA